MSLDFNLSRTGKYDDNGEVFEDNVFSANITHNLNKMAMACGIYDAIWRPDENGYVKAEDIIEIVEEGLKKLKDNPEEYKKYNPDNGWGSYDGFVPWVESLLVACKENPLSTIDVWR